MRLFGRIHLNYFIFITIFFSITQVCHAGDVLDRILSRGYISSVGTIDWPPYSSLDENGEYVGFDVDVGDEIARRMGVSIRRFEGILNWGQETGGNWDGVIDISLGSMTPTAKRGENLDFPAIYYYGIGSLAVHKDNTSIRVPADASGKRIGTLSASVYDYYVRRTPFDIEGMPPVSYKIDDPNIINYEQESDVYNALARGDGVEIDALINFLPVLMSLVKDGSPFRIIGQPLFRTPQAVAIEPGDLKLAEVLAKVVYDMHEDGTLSELSMKWFDFDMTKP